MTSIINGYILFKKIWYQYYSKFLFIFKDKAFSVLDLTLIHLPPIISLLSLALRNFNYAEQKLSTQTSP